MTGMMPAWLTLSGMYVERAAEHLAADHPAGVLHRDPALGLLDEDDGRDDDQTDQHHDAEDPPALGLLDVPQRRGEGRDDLGEDQDRHAVADAAVGDELAEPHDHRRAGGHRDDHDQEGDGAVAVQQVLVAVLEQLARAGQGDDAGGLQDRQAQGQVAGVLRDLGLARLAFLLERLQARDHHDEQLQDDARGDVGHDPQREDRQLQERATGEQVDQAVEPGVLDLVEAGLHVRHVDPRRGHLRAQAEDHDDEQHEQQLASQVRCPESVDERAKHRSSFFRWLRPRAEQPTEKRAGGAAQTREPNSRPTKALRAACSRRGRRLGTADPAGRRQPGPGRSWRS